MRQYFANKYHSSKYKGYDAGFIDTPTGEKIVVYLGGAMESSYKCFRGWSIGSIVLEELNLLHENTINEAKGRTLMAKDPKYFISHNPVSNTHPIYQWLNELLKLNVVNYDHSTIFDNPSLTDERRDEIIKEFDPDSIFYRQYILGERVDAEGAIYNIRDYNILDDFYPDDYMQYITVADPGENMSGTAFILAGLTYNKKEKQYEIHILKEYWHRNADYKNGYNIKLPKDYAADYIEFISECASLMGKYPAACLLDEDITFYRELQLTPKRISFSLFKYPEKIDIETRVKTGINLLYRGKLRFYAGCKNVISQFKNAVYDHDKINKGKWERMDRPEIANIDMLDVTEYSFQYFSKYLTK